MIAIMQSLARICQNFVSYTVFIHPATFEKTGNGLPEQFNHCFRVSVQRAWLRRNLHADSGGVELDYSLIIKLTNGCNLNCSYCYHRRDKSRDFSCTMSHGTLETVIRKLLEHNLEFAEFIWHGGEPLLAGIDTFRFIVQKQKELNRKGLKIKNCVQTNGTLLNDDYIQFFKDNDFDVGISIDGPFDMHADKRTDISEYETILRSLKKLNQSGSRFGTLCVVGKQHIGQAARIFDLLNENHILNLGFLPCLVESNGVVDHEYTISPKEYGQFLIDFFEIWIHSDMHGLCVRNIDDCIRFYRNHPAKTCIHTNSCDRYLTVMPDGGVYLCDNFASNEAHRVGHVDEGFDLVDKTEAMIWLKNAMQKVPEACSKCKYYCGCHSGCKHRRWVRDPSMQHGQYYCLSTRMLYDHVGKYFAAEER